MIRLITQVPFADTSRRVANGFEGFGYCQFLGIQAADAARYENPMARLILVHVDAPSIATGEEAGPRGRAHGTRRVEVGKNDSYLG